MNWILLIQEKRIFVWLAMKLFIKENKKEKKKLFKKKYS